MKAATVLISGRAPGENLQDIEVPPGATALDVLKAVGLDRQWTLSRENSNHVFGFEEEVYDAIEPGAKLRATSLAEVGAAPRWILWLAEVLGLGLPPAPRPQDTSTTRIVTGGVRSVPRRSRVTVATAAAGNARVTVQRDQRSLWEIRGWRRRGKKLVGAYRLGRRGAFTGEIHLKNRNRPEFFIINPPVAVLRGGHASCFRHRGKGKYAIHFGIGGNIADPDAGLIAVEKLLAASI